MKEPKIDQFVIQEHTTPAGVHWDLMLEHEGVLWTWRLNSDPDTIQQTPIDAERIFDHPLRFLSYEGPVQNAAGSVRIADKGTLRMDLIEAEQIICQLDGGILKGTLGLGQVNGSQWTLQRRLSADY